MAGFECGSSSNGIVHSANCVKTTTLVAFIHNIITSVTKHSQSYVWLGNHEALYHRYTALLIHYFNLHILKRNKLMDQVKMHL